MAQYQWNDSMAMAKEGMPYIGARAVFGIIRKKLRSGKEKAKNK